MVVNGALMLTYPCLDVWSYVHNKSSRNTTGDIQHFGERPILFQHDNAPVHKARSIQRLFVEIGVIGVEELDWPEQSPDLNPIKHLLGELERRLRWA